MKAAIYEVSTGRINRFIDVIVSQLDIQCQPGEEFYLNISPGTFTHIIDFEPVSIPIPPIPDTVETLLSRVRMQRDCLLDGVDLRHCNPEKWSTMTQETKDKWIEYKQKLRDFPTICDPENPVWPMVPN